MLMGPKNKITIPDLKKLDKHIIDNFIEDKITGEKELEINKDIYWVEGYMCAIWSSPNIIKMDNWLPPINGDCVFQSEKHINEIMSLIFGLQAAIVSKLNNNSYKPLYEKYNIKNEPKNDLVKRWSKGYIFGAILSCPEFVKKDEIITMLTPIMIFADDSKKTLLGKKGWSTQEVMESIPMAVNGLARVFRGIRVGNIQKIAGKKIIANDNKLGRNDLCHCGSGKKYKKCCMTNGDL